MPNTRSIESQLDRTLPALELVFGNQVNDRSIDDEATAELAAAIIREVLRDKVEEGEDAQYETAVDLIARLMKSMPQDNSRLKTKRLFWNRLLQAWGKTTNQKVEEKAALILIERPSFTGPSPEVKEWEEAVKAGMRNCFDQEKLKRLLLLGASGNRVLFERAFHRYIELNRDDAMRDFLAASLSSMRMHARVAGPMIIAHLEETTAMLEELRGSWSLMPTSRALHRIHEPEVISSTHIRFLSYMAPMKDNLDRERQEITKLVADAAQKLQVWKREAPKNRNFRIDLVIKIVPYSYGWEHKINELEPIGTIEEKV